MGGYIGIMETNMETTGLGFRGLRFYIGTPGPLIGARAERSRKRPKAG